MEYTRRYPSRYVTCVLLLFTLMLRAGMTVAATEAAISGYEIEGISAAMTLEEIRSKLEATGYAYQGQDSATGARMFFIMKDNDNIQKSVRVEMGTDHVFIQPRNSKTCFRQASISSEHDFYQNHYAHQRKNNILER